MDTPYLAEPGDELKFISIWDLAVVLEAMDYIDDNPLTIMHDAREKAKNR